MPCRTIFVDGIPDWQRPRAIVIPPHVAAPKRAERNVVARGSREEADSVAEVEDWLGGELDRHDLHEPSGELRRLVGRIGLAHLHAVDETCREEIQRDDLLVGFGRGKHRAGQRRVAVALTEATHEDILSCRQPRRPSLAPWLRPRLCRRCPSSPGSRCCR